MLNPQQLQAAEGLCEFVNQKQYSFALLLGPAGSGKTFTVANVINRLDLQNRPLVVACPTHKAKRVLVAALQKHGIEPDAMTVAALIGKAPSSSDDPDDEGKAQWLNGGGSTLRPNSLLVLDEISMIDFRDMKAIKAIVESTQSQAILTGDFSQLRPVKGQSIAEAVEKIPLRFALSEVMRSEAGNIVATSKAVRTTGELDPNCFDSKSVLSYNNSDTFEQQFLDTENAVAIAYTNKRVSELNAKKRVHIYGPDKLKDFMPEEEVILTEAPLMVDRRGSFSGKFERIKVADNNDQLIVKRCGPLQKTPAPVTGHSVEYYDLELFNPETGLTFDAKGLTYDMYMSNLKPVMDDLLAKLRDFSGRLGKIDEALLRRAARETRTKENKFHVTEKQIKQFFSEEEANWLLQLPRTNPKFMLRYYGDEGAFSSDTPVEPTFYPVKGDWKTLRKLLWARDYFGFRGEFAVLLYGHASTAHKAQGSTYKHVFVDWPNLMTIRDTEDRQAACYVAVSRASESLHIRV